MVESKVTPNNAANIRICAMKEHDYHLESVNLKNEYKEDYYVIFHCNKS